MIVVVSNCFCMIRWLPRCRTATNPFVRVSGTLPSPKEPGVYPNRYLDLSYEDVVVSSPAISDRDAVSKNRVKASMRFARDSSIDSPSLAISSSGHNATYPPSSRSIIAVNRCDEFMFRVYPESTLTLCRHLAEVPLGDQ